MKVTIDTKEDSHEDIKRVLHLLTHIIEKKDVSVQSNYESSSSEPKEAPDTTNLMSMFSNPEPKKEVPDTPPDFSSFLNLTNKPEDKKDDKPEIEFF